MIESRCAGRTPSAMKCEWSHPTPRAFRTLLDVIALWSSSAGCPNRDRDRLHVPCAESELWQGTRRCSLTLAAHSLHAPCRACSSARRGQNPTIAELAPSSVAVGRRDFAGEIPQAISMRDTRIRLCADPSVRVPLKFRIRRPYPHTARRSRAGLSPRATASTTAPVLSRLRQDFRRPPQCRTGRRPP